MSPSETVPPTDKPAISGRDVSFHETQAGIAARDAAADSGGDPAQLRALVGAARSQQADSPTPKPGPLSLKGIPLQEDNLIVTMCFMLYKAVFGTDPRQQLAAAAEDEGILRMQAIAALALILTKPDTAYDLLDHAADKEISKEDAAGWARDFRREALDFAGRFGTAEIVLLTKHLVNMASRQGAQEEEPGK